MDKHPLLFEEIQIGPHCRVRKQKRLKQKQKKQTRQRRFQFRRALADRKNRFRPHVREAACDDATDWQPEDIIKLHLGILSDSCQQLAKAVPDTDLFADLATWITADERHAFSFLACCSVAEVDAEDTRTAVVEAFLKQAISAIRGKGARHKRFVRWMNEYAGPLSFSQCCEMTGNRPEAIRRSAA